MYTTSHKIPAVQNKWQGFPNCLLAQASVLQALPFKQSTGNNVTLTTFQGLNISQSFLQYPKYIYTSARFAIVYHSDKNYGNTKSPLQFLTKVQTFYKKSRLLAKSIDFL